MSEEVTRRLDRAKCRKGEHDWEGCRCLRPECFATNHDWDGCLCSREGCKARRNDGHEWASDDTCGHCGTQRSLRPCVECHITTGADGMPDCQVCGGTGERWVHACPSCDNPLHVIPTVGRPEDEEWRCYTGGCELAGVGQGPRYEGKLYTQIDVGLDGAHRIFRRGKESQNEENVPDTMQALAALLGAGFSKRLPTPEEDKELNAQGVDAFLIEPSGVEREVQVRRTVSQDFSHRLHKAPENQAGDSVLGHDLLERISAAITAKTEKTAESKRAHRVLALDVRAIDLPLFMASNSRIGEWAALEELARRGAWYAVVLVGSNKGWALSAPDDWPTQLDLHRPK